jgi:transmembrane sensor
VTAAAAAVVLVWSLSSRTGHDDVATPHPTASSAPSASTLPVAATIASDHERETVELKLADGSVASLLTAESRIETRRSTAAAIDLALERGSAKFDVVHRAGRRFRIWVASAYIEVVGTAFTVDRLAEGMRVSVERGIVKVVSAQGEMRLAAGASEVFPVDPSDDDRAPAPARTKRPSSSRGLHSDADHRPAIVEDQARALLHASETARKEGRPDEALLLLRRFLEQHRSDPRAPYAGFIVGRVLLEELDRPREAAAAFARVELLNPRTPLVEDALAREVESWFRAGDLEKARQRARSFLDRYPQGRRSGEVRRYGQME